VSFGLQTDNVSEGRFPDGYAGAVRDHGCALPGGANVFATLNQPPVLGLIGNRTADEGQTVNFTARRPIPTPARA